MSHKMKFEIFLEVAKELNKSFNLVPILFGSLGLTRVINWDRAVNDIDFLVPKEFLKENWQTLISLMENLGFTMIDEHEHEFVRSGESVAFGEEDDLKELAQVDPKNLRVAEVNGAKFRELSANQYLSVYTTFSRDQYRQEKRGKADQEKIAKIQEYLQKTRELNRS